MIDFCESEAADDPRFAYTEPTFAPPPGTWAPECGHPACVADMCPGYHDWDCPVAECRWNAARAGCELASGHEGEHSYAMPAAGAGTGATSDRP